MNAMPHSPTPVKPQVISFRLGAMRFYSVGGDVNEISPVGKFARSRVPQELNAMVKRRIL